AGADVGDGHRGDRAGAGQAGREEAPLPQDGPGAAAVGGVDGVQGVVFGGDEDDVVKTLLRPGGDVDAPDDERLGVDLAVDLHGVELAEGVRVDVGAGEQRLVQVLPGAGDVVVVGDDVGRRGEAHFEFFRPRPEPAGRGRPGPA